MKNLTLSLLGPPQVIIEERPVTFESRKAVALLSYLAVTNTDHNRAELATLLWPESDSKRARGALRYTLALLKKELGEEWLRLEGQEVGLQAHPGFRVDVTRFHNLLAEFEAHHHPQDEVCDYCLAALTEAAALYRDDFMTGFSLRDSPDFDEWQLFQTENLRRKFVEALKNLVHYHADRAEFETALTYARRWQKSDPLHEPAYRELMRLYAANGQWSMALHQYKTCVRVLDDEFGVAPMPETITLYERIRLDKAVREQPDDSTVRNLAPLPADPITPIHNLPSQLTPFINREKERAELTQYLTCQKQRLLTLVGPGGMGKTRLAIEVAAAHRDKFADGIYFINLAPLKSAENIVPAIADAIRLTFCEGCDPYCILLEHLQDKQLLLMLDNMEHLLNGGREATLSLIMDLLQAAPRVEILVTSRERLKLQQEQVYPVQGLHFPTQEEYNLELTNGHVLDETPYSAITLFQQRAQQVQPGVSRTDLSSVIRICRLTEGMPLAIELAASLAGALSLPSIATQIERNLAALNTDLHDLSPRHRSIYAVFDSSWQTLTDSEQAVFAKLSVFDGGFTDEAAEQIAQASLDVLVSLINKSLLRRDSSDRYSLHELMRQYTAEKLALTPSEETNTRQRHSAYYADYLSRLIRHWQTDYLPEIMDKISVEIDNIRTGLDWQLSQGDAVAISNYVGHLWPFYKARGRFAEAVDTLNRALNSIENHPANIILEHRVEWERLLGEAYFGLGQAEESQKHLRRTLDLVGQPLPATRGRMVWGIFGQVARQILTRLRPKSAHQPASGQNKSAALTAARAYDRLGQIGYLASDLILGSYAYLRGLNLAEKAGASPTLAIAYANVGLICGLFSRYPWADGYAHLAEKTAGEFRDLPMLAAIALRRSVYHASAGHWPQAIAEGQRALRVYQRLEDWRNWGDCLTVLGSVTFLQGHARESITYCTALQTLSNTNRNVEHRVWAICGQGFNLLNLGRTEEALDLAEELAPFIDEARLGQTEEAFYHSLIAVARLRQGEKMAALQAAHIAANCLQHNPPINLARAVSYNSVAEVYLTLWEQATIEPGFIDETTSAQIQERVQRICRTLYRYVRFFPARRPFGYLYQGRYDWLAGQRRRAYRNWLTSLTYAQQQAMPYVEGTLHYQIGRHLPQHDANRQEHLRRAVEIFKNLGAAYDLAQAQAILEEK